jgi:hypothetical protein
VDQSEKVMSYYPESVLDFLNGSFSLGPAIGGLGGPLGAGSSYFIGKVVFIYRKFHFP